MATPTLATLNDGASPLLNFEIAPDQSVSFGYTLSYEEKAIPEDFEIYSRRIEVKSGYDVEFNVTNDWSTGF